MAPASLRLRRKAILVSTALLLALVVVGGFAYAARELRHRRQEAGDALHILGAGKSLQISEWYRERLDDAAGRAQDPLFVQSFREYLNGDRTPALVERLRGSITPKREPWRYLNLWILDRGGTPVLNSLGRSPEVVIESGLATSCLADEDPVVGILQGIETAKPYIDMCTVIADRSTRPPEVIGAYLFRIDATQLLLPTIRFWPVRSASAATLVLRESNGQFDTLFSSDARDRLGEGTGRIPAEWLNAPDGHRDGLDRNGQPVLAEVQSVASRPWKVVVTLNRVEAQSDAYAELLLVGLVMLLLLATGVLAAVFLNERSHRSHALEILRMDRLLQVRSGINEAIVRIHDRSAMFERFCEIAASLGRFELAAVFELMPDGVSVRIGAACGNVPSTFTVGAVVPMPDGLAHGPLRPAVDPGEVVVISDLLKEVPTPWIQNLVKAGHRAVVVVPIRERGIVRGFFGLYSKEAGAFDHRNKQLFVELGGDIAFALENIEAEQRRREMESQLSAILDAAPFAMFLVGGADHRIKSINQAAIRQYGYLEMELIGMDARDLLTPRYRSQMAPSPRGSTELPRTATHTTKGGKTLKVEVITRAVTIDGDSDQVVVAIDVTERQQLEQQFQQAQRLEAVGRLAGGIAHDFNNLLTVISGFSAFVLEDLPPGSLARGPAEQIQVAATRAAELTSSLLAFSRRQTLKTEAAALNGVVRETAMMLGRVIGEDIVVDLQLRAERDMVNVDRSQMQQVIMNLAVNARDAMPKGGRLTVSTADAEGHSPLGAVELSVADSGDGIPAEVVDHIFEPFFTTKPLGEGTGLGLASVHGIVTQSGGTISVETAPGRGTTFKMTFPRSAEAKPMAPPKVAPIVAVGPATILLVEDDEGVRALTRIVLGRGGFSVIEHSSASAALERMTDGNSAHVDLLLTDVVMPGISGPELAEHLQRHYPKMAVLFMSGYAEDSASRSGFDLRKLDLLRKPFTPKELLDRVRAALQKAAA